MEQFNLFVGTHGEPNEIFVLQRSWTPHLFVSCTEGVSKPLNLNAGNDEIVQSEPPGARVEFAQEVLDKCRSKSVTHLL